MLPTQPPGLDYLLNPKAFPPTPALPPDPLVFLDFLWSGIEVLIRAMVGG